ncbi:MAG TPA: hypothetical protein VIG28_08130 [Leifsonia sp.]
MSDRDERRATHDTDPATGSDELTDAVSDLGETDDERLEAVAEHNRSLEERLPGDDELPLTKG